MAMIACTVGCVPMAKGAVARNLAPSGTPILGVGSNVSGTSDVTVAHLGPISEINDGVWNTNLAANGYQIDADGQSAANGNGADTFAGGLTTGAFDYVGVLFNEPQFGVSEVRVQNFLANDGGWWGPTTVVAGGTPLAASDLVSPQVQVSFDSGETWTNVATTASDYVAQYTGAVRGTGFLNATSGPFATIAFFQQGGITGIRLIGGGAGPADGNGFIGVNEFEVIGAPQELSLEVNTATGLVQIRNDVQSAVRFDFYEVASNSGALNLAGWNSLQDPSGNPSGFPPGAGTGNGWERLGNLDSSLAAEAFLQGSSSLGSGESVPLGYLFAGNAHDLSFRYRTSSGRVVNAAVSYIAGLTGDFNDDGRVDGGDFLLWQRGLGGAFDGSDLAEWRANLGSNPADAFVVPEGNIAVACLLAMSWLFIRRRRRSLEANGLMNC
jgi:hypothetical protein